MSTTGHDPRDAEQGVAGRVERPPAPGTESAGPALTELVVEFRRTTQALEQLTRQARLDAQLRLATGVVTGNTDANGDAALRLFEVPAGATGSLMLLALDEGGVTPAAPDTAGTLWHAIYAGPQGASSAAQIISIGNMLDCQPLTPAADAQIPYSYTYADRWGAPTLRGPQTFWLVVDGATAARQLAARFAVLLSQPDS